MVDRALRHLLTDITGNTHRAEFCIDKLYSPDSARGRLGLLELRGFEMPPHAQMAMVQSLLVRSLVSWFWDDPLRAPLIRHGDDLHGRYLLPHFVIADIAEVAADLRAHGIDFQTSWLDPFTEFRFPRLGTADRRRGGDSSCAGRSSRGTCSARRRPPAAPPGTSTPRSNGCRCSLTGAAGSGQVWVTCNGFPVPLRPTAHPRTAGGRRSVPRLGSRPARCTRPSRRTRRWSSTWWTPAAGCRWAGRPTTCRIPVDARYDTPPVNAMEAEARRTRRFDAAGHSPGDIDLTQLRERAGLLAVDSIAPGMLDLRRARAICR